MLLASLRGIHQSWAWVVIIGNGAAGLWALAAHWRPELRRRPLWWFTAAAQLSIFVQVVIGVALAQRAPGSDDRFHEFYGYIAIVAVGILYSYRQQLRDRIYLLYGFGSLFVMGLAIRALTLA